MNSIASIREELGPTAFRNPTKLGIGATPVLALDDIDVHLSTIPHQTRVVFKNRHGRCLPTPADLRIYDTETCEYLEPSTSGFCLAWDSTYIIYTGTRPRFVVIPLGVHNIYKVDAMRYLDEPFSNISAYERVNAIVWATGKRISLGNELELVPISTTEMLIKSDLDVRVVNVDTGHYEDSVEINWLYDYMIEIEDLVSFVLKGDIWQGWYTL